ncbi:MAG: GNAT family N-acetyltransferase [Actinomycetota bacterium]|nr:GNAT family N-acetyltransferase [Actinomycetota bacterium]
MLQSDVASLEWVDHADSRMPQVTDLRHTVLMAPFGVKRDENWGDEDPHSHHLLALEGGRVVGYSRLIDDGTSAQIRQVAVAFERQRAGVGRALMLETLRRADALGLAPVFLHARLSAVGFYERFGFAVVSDDPFPYGRTGLPHVRMELREPQR